MRLLVLVASAFSCAALVAGCGNGDDRGDFDENGQPGTVTIEWTVGGGSDATGCAAQGASSIEIDVYDQSGAQAGSYTEACTSGSDVITLSDGQYSATAQMLDVTGKARTTTVDIEPFTVAEDASYIIPIDFPFSSFL